MRNDQLFGSGNVIQWASVVLRLAVGSLFFAAAVRKLQGGAATIQNTVQYFKTTFENTWIPERMVTAHAYATPFIEALIVIWLISGFRLKAAWVCTALFATSLAFGMSVAGNFNTAADNYTCVLICCVGLLLSPHDRIGVDGLSGRSSKSCAVR